MLSGDGAVTLLLVALLALPATAAAQGPDYNSQLAAQLSGQPSVRISLRTYAPDLVLREPHLVGDTLEFAGYAAGSWNLDTTTTVQEMLLSEISRMQIRSTASELGAVVGFIGGVALVGVANATGKFALDPNEALFAGLLAGTGGALLGAAAAAPFHRWKTVYESPQ